MKKSEKIKKRINNYLFDHYKLRIVLEHLKSLVFALFSAIFFAFGFSCFVAPGSNESLTIVTGGVSGVSQNIVLLLKTVGVNIQASTLQSIFYSVINAPILIFGFFCDKLRIPHKV